jgi:integrase
MASRRQHPDGFLLRWREPDPTSADPRVRVQRSWVCRESEAHAEVYREEAERAERAGEPWIPPDRRPRPGRPAVNAEMATLIAEHGLRGIAAHYTKELRVGLERRPGTVEEVQHSLRSFLRWLAGHLRVPAGARIDPGVLSVPLLHSWWEWMLSPDRVVVYPVRRGAEGYERTTTRPLKRSSAYKHWTSVVAFWRWAASVDEFEGAVPRCPTPRLRKPYVDPNGSSASRKPVVAPSWEQAAACVAAVPTWVRPLVVICYYTGLRVEQARSVRWADVHVDDAEARQHGGPVLWVGTGKTQHEREGHMVPLHPELVRWLCDRRRQAIGIDALPGDLRRTGTRAYAARVRGLEEGRVAWEVGDQNLSLQLSRAWKATGVPDEVWTGRTAHAFRKALRTNVMQASTEPNSKAWQAAERLIGHRLPGQVGTYQADRALMPTMRQLLSTVPRWEDAAAGHRLGNVLPYPGSGRDDDLAALA